MKWTKLGRVFQTQNYAQTPTPLVLDDRVRVFYAERDERNRAFISSVDLDINDPTHVLGGALRVLSNGRPGTFDDEGQMPSFALRDGEKVNLYYSGWNSRNTVPYHNASGVAVSFDRGATFERPFEGPILDRTPEEPHLAVTPSLCAGRTYYVSGLRWELINDRYEPIYTIHSGISRDGVHWERHGEAVHQSHALECFSRPWVMQFDDGYCMWYCHRHAVDYRDGAGAYRIGCAISQDGANWTRCDDEAGITVSEEGWDSTMICYPAVFKAKGKLYMLYNGNTFGKHGFGIAVAE